MATPTTKTELLKTHEHELTKTHQEFDVNNRVEYVYTASDDTPNGGPCICTRYSYDGISQRVVFQKEYYAAWDSAWDVF